MNDRSSDNHKGGGSGIGVAIYVVAILGMAAMIFALFQIPDASTTSSTIPISQLAADARDGNVSSITVTGDTVNAKLKDGTNVTSQKEPGVSLVQTLRNYGLTDQQLSGITIDVKQAVDWGGFLGSLIWILPMLFLMIFFFSMFRQGQSAGSQAFSFGKSKARRLSGDRPEITFDDVAGVEEAKEDMREIVEFLKSPRKFQSLGARTPKGLLMVGPPGTGKTLLARAVAGEAGVPFFSISGSEFVELFVGVGAARVRDLFDQAKKNAPCIVFIDEIDAVGRQRGTGLGGGHDEREQTLNQILVEMDGFDQNTNIIVMAATNRPDVLDPALLRPGRFDRRVTLDAPDITGREAILKVHARGKPLEPGVNLRKLASQTAGFSGADLENTLNEAAILAARHNKRTIGMKELEDAIDRVVMGPERKSRVMSPREKAITAYHEAGHAVVAKAMPHLDPVHKITIVARGVSGGHTRLLPTEDRYLWTRSQMFETLAFALGGLVAEELVFGETTTGPGSDLDQASNMAHKMVAEYGMSDVIGPVRFGHSDEYTFLGRELGGRREYSEETAAAIDGETRHVISQAEEQAREALLKYGHNLRAVAEALIEKETLSGEELDALLSVITPIEPMAYQPEASQINPKPVPADSVRVEEPDTSDERRAA